MKIVSPKQTPHFLVAGTLILVVLGIFAYYQYQQPKEIKTYDFFGTKFEFREDLRLAQNISVSPSSQEIMNKVWDPDISKIHIVFVPTENESVENSWLALNVFELRYKLDVAYHNPRFGWVNEFNTSSLESFDDITAENDTLVIALVRPSLADKTAVEMDGNTVYIKGQSGKELDLATIRFLMSALNITVS